MTEPEPIEVSFSEVDTARQCPHKHELGYLERWRHNTEGAKVGARDKGTLFHALMEAWYGYIATRQPQLGASYPPPLAADIEAEGVKHVRAVFDEQYDKTSYDAERTMHDMVWWCFERYTTTYGVDPQWFVLGVEHSFKMPLNERFTMKGKIDLIVRDRATGQLLVIDHKSGAQLPRDKDMDFDVQLRMYLLALRQNGFEDVAAYALYNSVRLWQPVRKPEEFTTDKQFLRTPTRALPSELETMRDDFLADIELAYSPVPARGRQRHYDQTTCGWRCDFTEACLVGAKYGRVKERQYLEDLGFTQNWERH